MFTLNAVLKNNEESDQSVIADVTIKVNTLNYTKLLERLYPMIIDNLYKKSQEGGAFPSLFAKLEEIKEMTSDAIVSFLSAFPDEIKESLIKAAFDDIVNEQLLAQLNEKALAFQLTIDRASLSLDKGNDTI